MGNILDEILTYKRREVQALGNIEYALTSPRRTPVSMKKALLDSPTGIIAEFKRRSPSKGDIHPGALPHEVLAGYEASRAAACSVLTDTPWFGGGLSDLAVARKAVHIPLLRKEFVVSRRQILEAYIYGADAVLLIAAALTREEVADFTDYAHSLGLETLFEIHNTAELSKLHPDTDMVGVNNRDLTTFITDPEFSLKIVESLPDGMVKVAESGLTSMAEVRRLREAGYRGFLIGERFMREADPALALSEFVKDEQ